MLNLNIDILYKKKLNLKDSKKFKFLLKRKKGKLQNKYLSPVQNQRKGLILKSFSFLKFYYLWISTLRYQQKHFGKSFFKRYICAAILGKTQKGFRHQNFLPVRGQRTRSNRKTARFLSKGRVFLEDSSKYSYISKQRILNLKKHLKIKNANINYTFY